MPDRNPHARAVETWLAAVIRGRRRADTLASFERAFAALWGRASSTLGAITLIAVTERVLFDAAETFPAFAGVAVDARGLRCDAARGRLRSMSEDELRASARFILTTWLSVLGSLTADILTPALHAALADVTTEPSSKPRGARASRHRKDRKS